VASGTGGHRISLFISSWVVQREIEKRKSTQETLQKSEIKYRNIIDNANSIIMELDTLGNITFINRFALEFFGYKEEVIIGQNIVGTMVAPSEIAERDREEMLNDIVTHPEKYLIMRRRTFSATAASLDNLDLQTDPG
jgi:PAS domain-containing protein